MEITLNITGLDKLADAILALAGAITGVRQQDEVQDKLQQEPLAPPASRGVSGGMPPTPPAGTVTPPTGILTTPPTGIPTTPPTGIPTTPPTGIPTTPPTGTVTPPAGQVVTSSTTYSMEDLARAAVQLMDNGKQDTLIQLLASFGVSSLPDLSQDQYGTFATALRGMGAQI